MLHDIIKNKEMYIGKEVFLDNEIEIVGVDEVIMTNSNKTLFTNDIHTCICLLVIGDEVGMCHLNICGELTLLQQKQVKQLLNIKNIKEIDTFIGPKTNIESLNELNKYIPSNNYPAYINNPLGIDVATGNIAYDINAKKLYGYNDDGFVEYKKGYINILNCNEITKKI